MTHKARGRLARLGVGSLLLLSPLFVVQLSSARPASAVSGIELVRANSGYSTHYWNAALANCPAGKVVLGGGATITGGMDQVVLSASIPASDGRTYLAAGRAVPGFTGSWSVAAYAICAPAPVGYEVISTSIATSETFQLGRADCSPGKRALSAGAQATRNVMAVTPGLTLIRPDGYLTLGWAAARTVVPNQSSTPWQLDTTVICVDELPGQQSVGKVANAAVADLQCPPGTQVHGIGGGSSLTDSGAYFLSSLQLSTDRQVVTASMTGVANNGGMVVQATCGA
jgi:hypothetical protein